MTTVSRYSRALQVWLRTLLDGGLHDSFGMRLVLVHSLKVRTTPTIAPTGRITLRSCRYFVSALAVLFFSHPYCWEQIAAKQFYASSKITYNEGFHETAAIRHPESTGCPPGIRTPICCSRGSCPTIERGGNAANKKPANSPGLPILRAGLPPVNPRSPFSSLRSTRSGF
jgi:hypothetical protein